MSVDDTRPRRRVEDHFGMEYVVDRLVVAVDELGKTIAAMATKAEVGVLFAKMDEKADAAALDKIDQRLTRIERNQLPPWTLGVGSLALTVVLAVVAHYWK